MKPADYLQSAGVALSIFAGTVLFSIPMVAVYAFVIAPGQPPEFYNAAAQWIAPWSSHLLGPLLFFAWNYWLARRRPSRDPAMFAAATFGSYVAIDAASLPLFGIELRAVLSATLLVSLAAKATAAFAGGYLGRRSNAVQAMRHELR